MMIKGEHAQSATSTVQVSATIASISERNVVLAFDKVLQHWDVLYVADFALNQNGTPIPLLSLHWSIGDGHQLPRLTLMTKVPLLQCEKMAINVCYLAVKHSLANTHGETIEPFQASQTLATQTLFNTEKAATTQALTDHAESTEISDQSVNGFHALEEFSRIVDELSGVANDLNVNSLNRTNPNNTNSNIKKPIAAKKRANSQLAANLVPVNLSTVRVMPSETPKASTEKSLVSPAVNPLEAVTKSEIVETKIEPRLITATEAPKPIPAAPIENPKPNKETLISNKQATTTKPIIKVQTHKRRKMEQQLGTPIPRAEAGYDQALYRQEMTRSITNDVIGFALFAIPLAIFFIA